MWERKKINLLRLPPRFRSQQFFLSKVRGEILYPIFCGHAMLVPFLMGTNMAAGNQQKHLSLSFATKARIYFSRNLKPLK